MRNRIRFMLVLSGGVVAAGLSAQVQDPLDQGNPITHADLTSSVAFPGDLVANANPTQLANYAWRLFIAANNTTGATLQSGAGREKPTGSFITAGKQTVLPNPVVFESFYHRTEAYPFYTTGNRPSAPIGQVPVYRFQDSFTVKGAQYVNLDETSQIGQNHLYFQLANDPNFPVLFMAKVNSIQVNYAWDRTPPTSDKSWVFPAPMVEIKAAWRRVSDLKNSNPAHYHQAKATYYVGDEGDTDPTPTTDTFALIGLHIIQKTKNYPEFIFSTFEHVDATTRAYKKQPFGFNACPVKFGPLFRNVTEAEMITMAYAAGADGFTYQSSLKFGELMIGEYPFPCKSPSNLSWPLYLKDTSETVLDPAYALQYTTLAYDVPSPPKATPIGAYTANLPGQPAASNAVKSYTLPKAGTPPTGLVTVIQPKTITAEVNAVNNQVLTEIKQADANSVWQNYRLKGVEGPLTSTETAQDFYLANIVIESSQPGIQLFRGNTGETLDPLTNNRLPNNVSVGLTTTGQKVPPAKFNVGGCQGCHGVAQQKGRDFSFLPSGAGGVGKEVESVPSSDLTPAQRRAHISAMNAIGKRKVD